ncbi:procollagen-lysine,2-oxoglutarate 5-dioxygenase [Euwallacea similis]|uniref:procollagen-lysine,2-oxoglutarate 5-dioxygenase n=1 Tax=Euwallacea similis TaxID=1736056 RepID=UPI00344CB300
MKVQVLFASVCVIFALENTSAIQNDILVFTVATNETDGYQRYIDSAKRFGIEPIILGKGEKWKGGDMRRPGGGWKINLLKAALRQYKLDDEKIVLFTDAYDVIFLGQLGEIVRRFKALGARVLFGAEPYCWPNVELAPQYPEITKGQRFLNSGIYIGYLPEINNILSKVHIEDSADDQLYFTQVYLDKEFREKNKIQLDHLSEIFQNMNGQTDILEIKTVENKDAGVETYYLKNTETGTEPLMVHGNGPSKLYLNYLTNYLPNGVWNSMEGCIACKKGQMNLDTIKKDQWPIVYLGLFIEQNTPFIEGFFTKIYKMEYPKEKIHLFVHNAVKFHSNQVNEFVEAHGSEYSSVKQIKPEDGTTEWAARDLSLDQCLLKKCEIYFAIDSVAHLDNPFTLKLLIEQNRTVVAPLLIRPGKSWSNFWGSLSKDGFYARSNDYMDIVHGEKKGLWNVPYINSAYLINSTLLKQYDRLQLSFNRPNVDADMAFCRNLRDLDVFMYVSNRVEFGHLINADTYDITRAEPDMYQIFENEQDWEEAFIHSDYPENLNPEKKNLQPCPDVYWVPIVTKKFCKALINMMESYGKWSSGKNEDDRLEGGYEAVPTRDIHMNQVGWEAHWLYFLQKYVRPVNEHIFVGYQGDPPRSLMNFVVRYKPDEQPSLRPHHDSSTYTINIALNEAGKDFEGGGCKFIRYNCSVTDTQMGWMLMHPGRLTHYHEGLLVTKGIRYIMVAFVDP